MAGDYIVIAFVSDTVAHARLQRAFGNRLVATSSLQELEQAFTAHRPNVVIFQVHSALGPEMGLVIKRIFQTRHCGLIAVYADLRTDHVKGLLSLGAAGASRLIVRDQDDDPVQLRQIARDAAQVGVDSQLSALARDLAPSLVSAVVDYCLCDDADAVTAISVATKLGLSRRTLSKRLSQLGVPGVSFVLTRTRVLLAVGLLLRGHKSEKVALRLGFSSASALRNMLRRHTQLRPSELASHGDLGYWCEKLLNPGNNRGS